MKFFLLFTSNAERIAKGLFMKVSCCKTSIFLNVKNIIIQYTTDCSRIDLLKQTYLQYLKEIIGMLIFGAYKMLKCKT